MKRDKDHTKIVHLDEVLKARDKEDATTALLKDTRRIAEAIESRTCAMCSTVKMCVNKSGLCAACYLSLSTREKKVADEEARHKKIEFKVTDDRWKRP